MMFDQPGYQGDTPWPRNIRKPDEPGVRNIVKVDEQSEVGINRNENSPSSRSVVQKHAIARIRTEFSGFDNVMPVAAKPIGQSSAGAAVEWESHESLMETAASVSPAITARA